VIVGLELGHLGPRIEPTALAPLKRWQANLVSS
jgi:hypothetical protein